MEPFAEEVGTCKCSHHLAGILLAHIKKRVGREQVYTPHVNPLALDKFVEGLYEIPGKKAVTLAHIHIHTLHAACGGATVLLLVIGRTFVGLGALPLTAFAAAVTLRFCVYEIDLGCVLVIIDQTVEFQ